MSASTKDIKRLIVLCDGTSNDSTADNATQYPTNVTRISRAISKEGTRPDGSKAQQIIYYQPGVGTGPTDKLSGGVYGEGLSANVRGAYGFLAHNYDEGDEIFFFGFSRGAYTARAIAGLVTFMGLLTKRGMDSFPMVYDAYYGSHADGKTAPELPDGLLDKLRASHDLNEGARDAIKIIGLWDTVGFHGTFGGEKLEFWNEKLSTHVAHGYHALALDEERLAFEPTPWDPPTDPNQISQVWFSGVHSDVGGGFLDHRLSDITLMWMITQCAKDQKLQFDLESYLLDDTKPKEPTGSPWATKLGPSKGNSAKGWLSNAVSAVEHAVEGQSFGVRTPLEQKGTQEAIHVSVHNRDLKVWPCKPLTGLIGQNKWGVKGKSDTLMDAPLETDGIELNYKGRVRGATPVVTPKKLFSVL